MPFFDDARGVNPVIGTILMVGVVVILSAAIGTFILSFGTGLVGPTQAGLEISSIQTGDNGSVTVSVLTMGNADDVRVTATTDGDRLEDPDNDMTNELSHRFTDVGQSHTFETDSSAGETLEVNLVGIARTGGDEAVVFEEVVQL